MLRIINTTRCIGHKGGEKTKTKKIEIFIALSILVGMVFLTLSPVLAADDSLSDSGYPKYQADNQNTGQSQYIGPQNNSTKWNYTIEYQITQTPSIGPDGTIYVPVYNSSNNRGNLYALNSDGTLKWNYTLNDGTESVIVGSPAICNDGTIYLLGQFSNIQRTYGTLLALNPDGTLKWNYTINDGISVSMYGSPAIGADGTIYFSGTINPGVAWYVNYYAMNPDGTLKWNFTDTNVDSGAYSTSSPAIGPDGTIYYRVEFMNQGLGNVQHKLVAMNPNGTVKWDNFVPFGTILYGSPSVATDGTIYIAGWFNFAQPTPELLAYNPDGTPKWAYIANEITNGWFQTTPAIANDGTIYVGGYRAGVGGMIYAINPDGTKKWSNLTTYIISFDPVIGADGTLYIGYGTLHALYPDSTQKWTLNIHPCTAPVIGPDGTLYVGMANYNSELQPLPGYSLLAINTSNPINDPTNNTNNTQASNVQAATTTTTSGNTVGMQTTGAPVVPLALAIFSVLGGLAATRKKQ